MSTPKDLDLITDVVLSYKPPEKAKASKRREKRGPNVLQRKANCTHVYNSLNKTQLQKAFGIAHRASENANTPAKYRAQFKAIADLIWKAHGEPGAPKPGVGAALVERITMVEGVTL